MGTLKPGERASFDMLLDSLATVYGKEGRAGGDAACAALGAARTRPFHDIQATSNPDSLVEKACTQANTLPIAATVQDCCGVLGWTSWEGEGLSTEVSSNLYTAELVGPDGHVRDDTVRVGLLVSAARTDYPISRHSGEETYLVISGSAEWSVGGSPYILRAPGSLIHHPSWVPHGRRTLSEVFLGAWRWSGDLDLDSFSVDGSE